MIDIPQRTHVLRPDTVVVDLDGTLANVDHRVHLVKSEKPDWDAFYSAVSFDTPNQWCAALIDILCHDTRFHVAIVSARRRGTEADTIAWLRNRCGFGGFLDIGALSIHLVREDDGKDRYAQDHTLKKAWLDSYGKERILFVIDDRQRVVDFWRSEGLVCLQAYAWEEYKRSKDGAEQAAAGVFPGLDKTNMEAGDDA